MPEIDAQKPEIAQKLDWNRIIRLREYVREWKSGYIARTVPGAEVKSLSPGKQYYVAVLPQADGSEHAIADHPKTGNGAYMWRCEVALIRNIVGRNSGLTWREVLCHPKHIARSLGARCLYHTKNFEANILDYLTCPPEKLAAQRYAVGRGAMRMARLANRTADPED